MRSLTSVRRRGRRARVAEHNDRLHLAVVTQLCEVRAVAPVFADNPHETAATEPVVRVNRRRELDAYVDPLRPSGLELSDGLVELVDADNLVIPTFLKEANSLTAG